MVFVCKDTIYFNNYKDFPFKKCYLNTYWRLIMQDERRLRINCRTAAKDFLGRVFVDNAILTNHGVHALWNVNRHNLTLRIEDDDDVAPVVASGIVLQDESNDTTGSVKELQMFAHQIRIA